MGALQGIGTPGAYSGQPFLWGGHPWAQSFTPPLSALPFSGYLPQANPFGAYSQPQGLQSLQMAIQQLVQIVPVQLHQIQQLIQLVAQQQLHQTPQMHALQPFPIPYVGGPTGWLAAAQTGQPQAFTGQAGYVM